MIAKTEAGDEVDWPFEVFLKWHGIEGEALCFLAVHCLDVILYFPGVIDDINIATGGDLHLDTSLPH